MARFNSAGARAFGVENQKPVQSSVIATLDFVFIAGYERSYLVSSDEALQQSHTLAYHRLRHGCKHRIIHGDIFAPTQSLL